MDNGETDPSMSIEKKFIDILKSCSRLLKQLVVVLSTWELTHFGKINRTFEMHVIHGIIFLNAIFEKYAFTYK